MSEHQIAHYPNWRCVSLLFVPVFWESERKPGTAPPKFCSGQRRVQFKQWPKLKFAKLQAGFRANCMYVESVKTALFLSHASAGEIVASGRLDDLVNCPLYFFQDGSGLNPTLLSSYVNCWSIAKVLKAHLFGLSICRLIEVSRLYPNLGIPQNGHPFLRSQTRPQRVNQESQGAVSRGLHP